MRLSMATRHLSSTATSSTSSSTASMMSQAWVRSACTHTESSSLPASTCAGVRCPPGGGWRSPGSTLPLPKPSSVVSSGSQPNMAVLSLPQSAVAWSSCGSGALVDSTGARAATVASRALRVRWSLAPVTPVEARRCTASGRLAPRRFEPTATSSSRKGSASAGASLAAAPAPAPPSSPPGLSSKSTRYGRGVAPPCRAPKRARIPWSHATPPQPRLGQRDARKRATTTTTCVGMPTRLSGGGAKSVTRARWMICARETR
mmetsp:Transcript_13884/g.42007  ORF Transcript_13884/g.42007 Transcript_13884/m.42007 type:complete len:260 (+) Transcript_13884:334-1113(+)